MVAIDLIGDALHNVIDGLVIGGSYAVSPQLGVTTTVAVRWNVLVSLGALAGGAAGILVGVSSGALSQIVAPLTAGTFLYLAGSDLVPELHDHDLRATDAVAQLAFVAAGVTLMAFLG